LHDIPSGFWSTPCDLNCDYLYLGGYVNCENANNLWFCNFYFYTNKAPDGDKAACMEIWAKWQHRFEDGELQA